MSRESPDAVVVYRLGLNERGNWVLEDRAGHAEAIFRDRRGAIHFGLFEAERPGAVLAAPVRRSRVLA